MGLLAFADLFKHGVLGQHYILGIRFVRFDNDLGLVSIFGLQGGKRYLTVRSACEIFKKAKIFMQKSLTFRLNATDSADFKGLTSSGF